MSQVNKERVEAFCAALEAMDEGQHIRQTLIDDRGRMCALGVGTKVALDSGLRWQNPWWGDSEEHAWGTGDLHHEVQRWYGFSHSNPTLRIPADLRNEDYRDQALIGVIGANDGLKLTAWQIAQLIRATYLKDEDA